MLFRSGFGKIVAESDNIEQLTYQISIGFNEQAEGKEDSWDQTDKMQLQPITTQEGIHKHKTQTQLESVTAESNKGLQGLMKS